MQKILDAKPYIIAEVGSNWHTVQDLYSSVMEAKESGANAVKFQYFDDWDLYGENEGHAIARWRKGTLDKEFEDLASYSVNLNVDFLCSAFSIEGYRRVDPFVKYHKIASSEFNHIPLVEFVKHTDKPILASIGGHDHNTVLTMLRDIYPANRTIPLYCTGAYPAKSQRIGAINTLNSLLEDLHWCGNPRYVDRRYGFSDHSLGIHEAVHAVYMHAPLVVEKHFRLDHVEGTPDAQHSLTPAAFKLMVDCLRYEESASFDDDDWPQLGWNPEEADFKRTALRRAKALVELNPGDKLQYGVNYAYFRDRDGRPGLSPSEHDRNEGRVVNTPLAVGACIEAGDLAFREGE